MTTAIWCARRGWPVLPLTPGRKTPAANCHACSVSGHTHRECLCRQAGRWCHGFHAATLDRSRISRWWEANPRFGVGISCGPANLVVIDIDASPREQPSRNRVLPGIAISERIDLQGLTTGFHSIAVLAALRGQSSPADDTTTLRVNTPSGGMHIWYRVTDSRRWQCSTGSGTRRALAWQVDVRAHGGYIIAPGTTTSAGPYSAVGTTREPAPLPPWLAQELERTGHLPAAHVPAPRPVPPRAQQAVIAAGGGQDLASRVLTTVLTEVAACAAISEGAGFNEKLNRAAYTAGGLVATGLISHQTAEQALRHTADIARPNDSRTAGIIRSGMEAGSRHPLRVGSRP
ncbi:bifunctional DNA primase/polymerase [Streptomyces chartreusis]